MALPPLNPNSTRRLWLDYTSVGFNHAVMLRLPDSVANPGTYAVAYANILAQRMRDSEQFFGARVAASGSNITFPIPFTTVPGVLPGSTNVWFQDPESTELSFTFRGAASGRKGYCTFYSPVQTPSWPPPNRYNPGYAAVIDTLRINFVAAAELGGTHPLWSIGGDFVVFHSYVNIRSNSYWQTAQR